MRFLKITRRPIPYITGFYAARPGLETADYATQFAAHCSDFYGLADSWAQALRAQGVDATGLICGTEPLDRAWWQQHRSGRPFDADQVLTEQLKEYRPDVLFLEGIDVFPATEIAHFRTVLPPDSFICGLTGTDLRANPALYVLDAVFSCMKGLVHDLHKMGKRAYFLPHGFEAGVLEHFPDPPVITEPANITGSFISGSHMHNFRIQVAERLIADHGISIYSNYEKSWAKTFARYAGSKAAFHTGRAVRHIPGAEKVAPRKLRTAMKWPQAPRFVHSALLARAARPGAYGLGLYDLLRRASMTVNVHAGLAEDYAANMRLYEATGIGVALVTDMKSDLHEFFEPDREVIAFSSADEASEKVGYLIENPKAAAEIAAAGQARTLRDHTYAARVPVLLDGIASIGTRAA